MRGLPQPGAGAGVSCAASVRAGCAHPCRRIDDRGAGAGAAAVKTNGAVVSNGTQPPRAASLAEALRQYNVEGETPLSFLEPRGLVNTGNMCYMNSVSTASLVRIRVHG